ncbi:Lrp/AsnC family transcriptional regulator [Glutamicibacter sp.]|uniref:Lrp/AsnC family transcriptional regulator n=1 Tax=Glutamicibacter sp. TaxID=1931995 RepID=UPI003D6C4FE1
MIKINETDSNSLDETDRKILTKLQEDGRQSYRQIARELDVSEGTIRFRVNKLQESGVLTIIAIADPFQLGYRIMAFLLLKVKPGSQARILDVLASWEETTYVSTCIGNADIYLQFVCRDNDHLSEFLQDKIGSLDEITSYETFMELKIHKVAYEYPISGRQSVDVRD